MPHSAFNNHSTPLSYHFVDSVLADLTARNQLDPATMRFVSARFKSMLSSSQNAVSSQMLISSKKPLKARASSQAFEQDAVVSALMRHGETSEPVSLKNRRSHACLRAVGDRAAESTIPAPEAHLD